MPSHLPRLTSIALAMTILLLSNVETAPSALGWPGHDWNNWKKVTTWTKPDLKTAQTGHMELVPLLAAEDGTSPIADVPGWEKRRAETVGVLQAILGQPTNLAAPRVEAELLGEEVLEDHVRQHIRIHSEADGWIPAYILLPKDLSPNGKPRPAMICLHQTVAQGKEEQCGIQGDPEMAFALELVRRGYVCIAPDAIGFGERIPDGTQPYHDSLTFYQKHPGWSFLGKMAWDIGRVVDYLETLPYVDRTRIGSIGHSHGAYGTLTAAALEPRIAACVASCGFTTFRSDPHPERWSHLTALVPQLGFYLPDVASIPFDWQHVCSLVAPRPMFVWYATKDDIFPNTDNLDAILKDVEQVYGLYGKADHLAWQAFDGPHRFPRDGRQKAYRWLDEQFGRKGSVLFGPELRTLVRANVEKYPWAAQIRDAAVVAAKPWMEMSDDQLWAMMFGSTITRSWMVWSNGHCPACKKDVPMYNWRVDALGRPWKMRCPHCQELFPKNDFQKFHRSGLDEHGIFDPKRADRALLFNTEHADPQDPLHAFGVDDGEGYVEGENRWRFIGAYLVYGQWKQAVHAGIRHLASAYALTGDKIYAHKAGVLLDRVADIYPTFDYARQGMTYEKLGVTGYVSVWHDSCEETRQLALAYDQILDAMAEDQALADFLAQKAQQYKIEVPKATPADVLANIEARILRDALANPDKIHSNYPRKEIAATTIKIVLGWPGNRDEVMADIDAMLKQASAVDGVTGEKGLGGYSAYTIDGLAGFLALADQFDPGVLPELLKQCPRLHEMYRFHIDTFCLGKYYPGSGDAGTFAGPFDIYRGVGLVAPESPLMPAKWALLWRMYQLTGDAAFAQVIHRAADGHLETMAQHLTVADPAISERAITEAITKVGPEPQLGSVNKREWHLAILRSGKGRDSRAVWLDYDTGGGHGHFDGMNLGLMAKGLDLMPDFGYPPVHYGGWTSPRSNWYHMTASHNTISVDGADTHGDAGETTLWAEGQGARIVRASGAKLIGGQQFERTAVMVDVSESDFYVVDLFRVVGGREHAKFLRSHYGTITTQGLSLSPAGEYGRGTQMRNVQCDTKPAAAWSVDWAVEDRLRLLEPGREIHFRYTDLSGAAEALVAESWISTGYYSSVGEAWIPTVIVRRKAEAAPLASTFVGILEPYEKASKLGSLRRLSLESDDGTAYPEANVALEIALADGRRDLLLTADMENPLGAAPAWSAGRVMIEKTSGLRLDGQLCLVRFGADGKLQRAMICRGNSLQAGDVEITIKNQPEWVEVVFGPEGPSVVGGNAADVEIGGK
jgi:dienelactone hydrolase